MITQLNFTLETGRILISKKCEARLEEIYGGPTEDNTPKKSPNDYSELFKKIDEEDE